MYKGVCQVLTALRLLFFFFSSRSRHTRWPRDWSSDVCSSDLDVAGLLQRLLTDRQAHLAELVGAVDIGDGEVVLAGQIRHVLERFALSLVGGEPGGDGGRLDRLELGDRKSTRLNSSHVAISYAVFCLKK